MMRHHSRIAISLLSISTIAALISASPSVAEPLNKAVKPPTAGRTTASIANTILSGVLPPKAATGINGDFYIDIKALNIYGPKAEGKWPSPISLRGAQGATGAPGAMGLDGDDGATGKAGASSLVAGPTGAIGASGAVGPKGEAGAMGAPGISGSSGSIGLTGSTGPAGVAGTAGSQGAQGAQGAPGSQGSQGSQGVKGDEGAKGEVGAQGLQGIQGTQGGAGTQGIQGAAGAKGDIGSVGPSISAGGLINFSHSIVGSEGASQPSNPFGGFAAGGSYMVRVFVATWDQSQNLTSYPLSISFSANGASPTIVNSFSVANGTVWTPLTGAGAPGSVQKRVSIIADLIIDGSSTVSPFDLVATVSCGENTGVFPLTLSGSYVRTRIGQVG